MCIRDRFCTLLMAAIYGIMGYVIVFVFTPAFLLGMGLCAMLCSFLMLRILYVIGGDPDAVPVSYTHLDVYKRQALPPEVRPGRA